MEKDYCYGDLIKWELFEKLLPQMLYTGEEGKRNAVFRYLKNQRQDFVYTLVLDLCRDDKKRCPYRKEDFKSKNISRGTVEMVQVELPPYNPDISDILRVYVLYPKTSDDISDKLYFIIKRFKTNEAIVLYVPAIGVPVEIADLTGHLGDMEYEYKALEAAYARIRNDIEISKGKWSRDWGEFDWQGLQSKFEKGEDVELSQEECMELFNWISKKDKKLYANIIFSLSLQKRGIPKDIANYCAEHPEVIAEAISKYTK